MIGFHHPFVYQPIPTSLKTSSPRTLRWEREALEGRLKSKPDDAPIYCRIAEISTELGEGEKARWAWEQAAKAYQALIAKEPKNWRWHLHLAEALNAAGKREEAKAVLKKATKQFADRWEVWLAIGVWELNRRGTPEDLLELKQRYLQWLETTLPYLERAVRLAPGEPQPYFAIASAYFTAAFYAQQQPLKEKWLNKAKDSAWQAAKRGKKDPLYLAGAILMELVESPRKEKWKQTMQATQELRQLAESSNQPTAWGLLGILNLLFWETVPFTEEMLTDAQSCFERAATLEPDRWEWREGLIGIMVGQERWQDALNIAEDWLRQHEAPRARFIAAKAAEKLSNWEKVEAHLKTALSEDENDFYLNLGMVVVELRKGEPTDAVQRALPYWKRVAKLSSPNEQARLDSMAIDAVMQALVGRRDGAIAAFQKVLGKEPQHPVAEEALEVLKGKATQ